MALPAKRLSLMAVAVTAWLLTQHLSQEIPWDMLFGKHQAGHRPTLAELIDILFFHRTAVRYYIELEEAQLVRENSALLQRVASESHKCKQALLNLALSPLGCGLVNRTQAGALITQIPFKDLHRSLAVAQILSQKGHYVGADLATDAAAAVLGYRWSDFTQLAYRVALLLYHSGGLEPGAWAHECFEATSVLRQLFDPGTVTLPSLLEHQDAGMRERWLDYMSIWYDQSAAHWLSDAGHMEVAEGPAADGRRPAFLLWALPADFHAPTPTMIWSHAFDLKSAEGLLRWRLVIEFNGTCMALGILPDTPPQRDHTLAVVYALMVRDVDGGALTSADLLRRQGHFQVRRRSRQPVMLAWDQCPPFQPPFPNSHPVPRRAEVVAVVLLRDAAEEEPACGQGQDAQICDFPSPTVEELVLRPNKFYRHAPREFVEAWGLPPGSPGFVRSAVLDSMDLHGAWGLDRGGPEQRTFWVPGDAELPPPQLLWGHAEGEDSRTEDSCSNADLHGACGLDRGCPEQCTFWVPGDSELPQPPPWGGAEGEDSETDDSCSDADLSTGSSVIWNLFQPEEVLLTLPGVALLAAVGGASWLCWRILALCLPCGFLKLTWRQLWALLCRASSLACGFLGHPQPSVPLGSAQRVTGTPGGIPRSRKRSTFRRRAAMAAALRQGPMEHALNVAADFAEMRGRALRSDIAKLREQAWQLVLWVVGPLALATLLDVLENSLAAAFTVVQRASRVFGNAAAKCARKRDTRKQTAMGRASDTNDRSGTAGTNLAGPAMPTGSSGTRGKAQGKPTSSWAKHQQQQQQTSGSHADKSARSSLRSLAIGEGSSTATGCSQGTPALGDSSQRANKELQVAAIASELPPKPRVPSQRAWQLAEEPAGASSSVATTRAAASAACSMTTATEGGSSRSSSTTAPAAPTRVTFRQRPAQRTQSAPQAIPLPAATQAPAVSPVVGLVARSGGGQNRAHGSLAQQNRGGQAGQQAQQQQQVPLQAHASTPPAAAGAVPLLPPPPVPPSVQPALVNSALLISRDLQQLAGQAATVVAVPTPQQVRDTFGGQGPRTRYNPIGLLRASSSSSSMTSSASQQQHSMGSADAALWQPGQQGMGAAGLPEPAPLATAQMPPLVPKSSWPVSSAATPASLLHPIFPPAAAGGSSVAGRPQHPPGTSPVLPPAAGAEASTRDTGIFLSEVPLRQPAPGSASSPSAATLVGNGTAPPPGHFSGHQLPMPIPLSPQSATSPEGSVHSSSHAGDVVAAERECVLCWDAGRETVLAPCGHRALCVPCTELLLGIAEPRCPICRRGVRSFICKEYDA